MEQFTGSGLEIDWSPHSFEDPGGRLFWKDGQVYRALRGKSAEAFLEIESRGLLDRLKGWGVVGSVRADFEIPEYDIVVSHQVIPPSPLVSEWSPEMLRDAAVLFCELSVHLAEHGFQLQDSHGWNVMFDQANPVYIDFASIIPLGQGEPWKPLHEFVNCFLHPIRMIENHAADYAFFLLGRDNWVSLDKTIPRFNSMQFRFAERRQKKKYRRWTEIQNAGGPQSAIRLSKLLLNEVSCSSFPHVSTRWSDYAASFPDSDFSDRSGWNQKQASVFELLQRVDTGTVLDIGCNTGWYSVLAARMGHSLASLDTDRSCIDALYTYSKERRLPITPVVGSFFAPVISHGPRFWDSLEKRFSSDHTMMLALIHHLFFKQGYDVQSIVRKASEVTKKTLILEYIPFNDYWVQQWGVPHRADEYRIECWLSELKQEFREIDIVPSEKSHESSDVERSLIFARR
ncbi:SAM-dependent methyltransferase [Rhodopirellula rubra]|uniref:SAM-dependent methyltransferase n=1 Tax=Aporhodopirellula rubra TaxID=980271 RepID=A0A7W5H3V0_9BACT|nr:class I SAM-dependent methyltransferase [Aporhodopirellula rubra]MBB3204280.1 SAM-dependent methyltransferase [Aporhodopirellula rubra]